MSTIQSTDSAPYDRADLEAIAGQPVVLNIGCGTDDRGVGIDKHYSPDITHDLNDGLPVADASVDTILAEHVLEHVNNPVNLLAECQRALVDGGTLELEVPNAGWLPIRLWLSQDIQGFWSHKDPDRDGHWLARKLGNTDPERTSHKSLWTKQLLVEHLERAGFAVECDNRHWARNLSVTATNGDTASGSTTLHHLEREAGEDLASGDYWAQTRARILAEWVRDESPDSVLDIGCGSGYLTAQIAAENPGADIVGVDVDADSIAVAQQRDTSATFETADVFDLTDRTADVVILADVIEHFEQPERVVAAARECLADDGVLLLSVPAYPSLFGPHDEQNGHYERYDTDRLETVADAAGLRVTDHRHTNVLPLPVYVVYQRILERTVPDSARGGHGWLVERAKELAIDAETRVEWPAGITLLARLEP